MGRKNYESIPKKYRPLPNRTNVVVTRNKNFKAEGCIIIDSIEKAIEIAVKSGDNEPFIIGGGQIYDYAIKNNLIDRIYLTRVHEKIEGDTFFEDLSQEWKLISSNRKEADSRHKFAFTFQVFEK